MYALRARLGALGSRLRFFGLEEELEEDEEEEPLFAL